MPTKYEEHWRTLFNIKFWNPRKKQKEKKSDMFRPKNRKVTYLLWFWPPPPTWHQILKFIRMFVTVLISYLCRFINNLYTHKVWRKLKDTFDYSPMRSDPIRYHQTRASRLSCKSCIGPRRVTVGAWVRVWFSIKK